MQAEYLLAHPEAAGVFGRQEWMNPPPWLGRDVVFGDPEGVYFIPPSQIQSLVDEAEVTHIHDDWTKKKFDEGKYVSTDIYSRPRDPEGVPRRSQSPSSLQWRARSWCPASSRARPLPSI